MWILLLLIWAALCALPAWIAERKGREGTRYAALAIVLGLILGLGWFDNWRKISDAVERVEASVRGYAKPDPYPLGPWPYLFAGCLAASLVAAFVPAKNRLRCPDCGEMVHSQARLCRFCRHEFGPSATLGDQGTGGPPKRS